MSQGERSNEGSDASAAPFHVRRDTRPERRAASRIAWVRTRVADCAWCASGVFLSRDLDTCAVVAVARLAPVEKMERAGVGTVPLVVGRLASWFDDGFAKVNKLTRLMSEGDNER